MVYFTDIDGAATPIVGSLRHGLSTRYPVSRSFHRVIYYVGPFLTVGLTMALHINIPALRFHLAVVTGLAAMFVHAGDTMQNYSTGSSFGIMFFNMIILLLLSNAIKECGHKTQKDNGTELPLWKSFCWAVCIQLNSLGIGWSYQVCGHACRFHYQNDEKHVLALYRTVYSPHRPAAKAAFRSYPPASSVQRNISFSQT